jgi:hypothetical protein
VASVGRPRAEGIARFYPGRDQRTSVRACHVRAGGQGRRPSSRLTVEAGPNHTERWDPAERSRIARGE